jgi:hypothetical protein
MKKPAKGVSEKVLQRALLRKAPNAVPDLLLFERETVLATIGNTKKVIGVPGQADLWGVWQGGIHIEIELKSVDGKLTPAQRGWKKLCLSNGIPHLVLQAWTGETVTETVDRWIQKIHTARPSKGTVVLQIAPRPPKASPEDKHQITLLPHARKDLRV